MKPGQIVVVDWRDSLPSSSEPNKRRPAIVVGSERVFGADLTFEMVVPLTSEAALAIPGASTAIDPSPENGCTKRSYALAWNVQTVAHARVTQTPSFIDDTELAAIRAQIRVCIDA